MANDENGEKTEQPTGRRVSQARSEGMVARSAELSQVLSMSTAFLMLQYVGPAIWQKLIVLCRWGLTTEYGSKPFALGDLKYHFYGLLFYLAPEILLLMIITAIVGAGSTLVQTDFLWAPKLFKPKFSHLNPINGLKRLMSLQNAFQVLKSLLKLAIIGPIAYYSFFEVFPQLLTLMEIPVTQLLPFTGVTASLVFWRIIKLLFLLAILDWIWQKYRVTKDLKMSKVEIKEEKMSTEGDERTRFRIRAKAMQRVRQRMMQNVKTADVVVTNPTHYAVALSYAMEKGSAPKVVAKGQGYMALKIREIAKEHGIPVIERKTLARALYKMVEVGKEIPYELYAAVAEILAYVYRLKGKNPFRNKKPQGQNGVRQ